MNQQSFGQRLGRLKEASLGAMPGGGAGKGQPRAAAAKPGTTNQAVLGPFTVRDLTVFTATLILFVASLLPMFGARFNLWNAGSLFFLGLGIVLPLIVSALFAARRLSPATKVRLGSLSIDQFASVVASFSVAFFFLSAATAYAPSLLVGLIGSVVLFAATVLGQFVPILASDFLGRDEAPAHVVARESAVPLPRPHTPKAPKPAAETAAASGSGAPAPSGVTSDAGSSPLAAEPTPAATPAPAAAAASGAAAVSSAPEVSEWTSFGDATPPTQAADVVPPAPTAAAAEETPLDDILAPAGAPADAGTAPADAGTAGASAATGAAAAATAAPTPAEALNSNEDGGQRASSARPAASEPVAATAVHQQVRSMEPIGATVDPASRPEESDEQPVHEAFWFAVAQHRTAVDPRTGAPAFVIEPGGWVLALEDRGHEFLVQHTDGRLGVLRDLSNIERG
jgi:hypothetical protein